MIRITASARKHRLTRNRILAALENAELVQTVGDAEYYIGTDNLGMELELIVVPDDRYPDRLACIHAMPTHYRENEEDQQR
ncbi:hypothetical protein DFR68_109223 [Nocardia mexicana]|uniref:Uncharacterized protein n=2 Tax=Nocardia mexicana TaxID=279262 RepID=A0A370GXA1_9NOCA|nr:hypothetical protein [Nocardia mexicana]RDI47224.1 hypothetical protein DFR68_109223 [Nocardia mexicana]